MLLFNNRSVQTGRGHMFSSDNTVLVTFLSYITCDTCTENNNISYWPHPPRPTLFKGDFSNGFICLSISRHCNSSYSFQGILMQLTSYCSHDLKMILFYRGHARLIFTRVIGLWQFSIRQSVHRHNLVSATPPTVFKEF